MRVLVVDNYDSFTYNLYHYLVNEGADTRVLRNDQGVVDAARWADAIVLSPGPGVPSETAAMFDLISNYQTEKPILGVCLGMQGMAEFFGARLLNQDQVRHGFVEAVDILVQDGIFEGLPARIDVGLYHSWMVEESSLPQTLQITARSQSGVVMGIQHTQYPLYGVQFHPESVMTECGGEMIANFLKKV